MREERAGREEACEEREAYTERSERLLCIPTNKQGRTSSQHDEKMLKRKEIHRGKEPEVTDCSEDNPRQAFADRRDVNIR